MTESELLGYVGAVSGLVEHGKFGWVMDPEGNRIELWQPPEGSEPGWRCALENLPTWCGHSRAQRYSQTGVKLK